MRFDSAGVTDFCCRRSDNTLEERLSKRPRFSVLASGGGDCKSDSFTASIPYRGGDSVVRDPIDRPIEPIEPSVLSVVRAVASADIKSVVRFGCVSRYGIGRSAEALKRPIRTMPISVADVPGPIWASVTRLWHMKEIYDGKHNLKILKLHNKHGHFVRIGPDEVSVTHPEAIKKLILTPLEKCVIYAGGMHSTREFVLFSAAAAYVDGLLTREQRGAIGSVGRVGIIGIAGVGVITFDT
ncbi:hypothetical protein PG995_005182 [Apiospora arundinis]